MSFVNNTSIIYDKNTNQKIKSNLGNCLSYKITNNGLNYSFFRDITHKTHKSFACRVITNDL